VLFLRDHGSAPHGGHPGARADAAGRASRAAAAGPGRKRRTAPSATAITKFAEEPVSRLLARGELITARSASAPRAPAR
jgi:hypothetical protein